jgi:hypothetical protein
MLPGIRDGNDAANHIEITPAPDINAYDFQVIGRVIEIIPKIRDQGSGIGDRGSDRGSGIRDPGLQCYDSSCTLSRSEIHSNGRHRPSTPSPSSPPDTLRRVSPVSRWPTSPAAR